MDKERFWQGLKALARDCDVTLCAVADNDDEASLQLKAGFNEVEQDNAIAQAWIKENRT